MKRQATHKEKISESHLSDKGIAIGIYKELSKLNSKKTSNPIRKQAKNISRDLTKEDMQVAKKPMKTRSAT